MFLTQIESPTRVRLRTFVAGAKMGELFEERSALQIAHTRHALFVTLIIWMAIVVLILKVL